MLSSKRWLEGSYDFIYGWFTTIWMGGKLLYDWALRTLGQDRGFRYHPHSCWITCSPINASHGPSAPFSCIERRSFRSDTISPSHTPSRPTRAPQTVSEKKTRSDQLGAGVDSRAT
ncbi:hypothetical protein CALVIDRAFT_537049 [Calocera viscosa TUFC12733]|uniref:Uncharacterized protein n=1 Tax=Calocera viscosa (strain TUFC12733) TaxID=1330018 RepID=A0A167MH67_CALVF|nr:hypothetical protein CALVIDRAFT_537049 [Calocera viscosa TUFC12733]